MNDRRLMPRAVRALTMLALVTRGGAQRAELVTVYMSPSCDCCRDWVTHLRENGLRVETHDLGDTSPLRHRYGVPSKLASCHTAVVAGYAIEGHVPALDIRRLLRERPNVNGLAVPKIAAGSPGRKAVSPQQDATLAFDDRRYWIFAQH